MNESIVFISAASSGSRVGAIFLISPAWILALIVGCASFSDLLFAISFSILWLCSGAIVALLIWKTSVYVSIKGETIAVGLIPLWKTRIALGQIVQIDVTTVDPYQEYGGWGIKGSAQSVRGRLYSVGGTHAISIITSNRKKYLIAFQEVDIPKTAAKILLNCQQSHAHRAIS